MSLNIWALSTQGPAACRKEEPLWALLVVQALAGDQLRVVLDGVDIAPHRGDPLPRLTSGFTGHGDNPLTCSGSTKNEPVWLWRPYALTHPLTKRYSGSSA
jgi:hypothetical protein